MKRTLDPLELGTLLLPLILAVNSLKVPYLHYASLLFGLLILVSPEARRSAWTHFGVVAIWTPDLVMRWFRHEDHVYMAVYWCLALGLSRLSANSVVALRTNARLLVGLCFAFAVVAKIRAADFLDSTLFHYTLLRDVRFRNTISETVGGLDRTMVVDNLAALAAVNRWDAAASTAVFHSPPGIEQLAWLMTISTLVMEGGLAVVFLAPDRAWLARWRHPVLIAFCVGIYFIAPVVGFGCLFFSIGAVLCQPEQRRLRLAYVGLYFALLLWVFIRPTVLAGNPPLP